MYIEKKQIRIEDIFTNLPVLTTDRLILRKVSLDDAKDMFKYFSNVGTFKFISDIPHDSIEETEELIRRMIESYENGKVARWGVFHKEDNKLIGTCGFEHWKPINKRAEIGFILSPKYWNRGITTEAVREVIKFGFKKMKLNRIEAKCTFDNIGSEKVLIKSGMKHEGTLRQYGYIKNQFVDVKWYSILKDEYYNPMPPDIHFKKITAETFMDICNLSETLLPEQRKMVRDNALSIAEAHFSENSWFRAIYADDIPIGFIMLHIGSDYDDDGFDINGAFFPGLFLWRFMIARPYQGKGYGKEALELLIEHLKARGYKELYTCCVVGEGSPELFYKKFGFVATGEMFGDEIELLYKF